MSEHKKTISITVDYEVYKEVLNQGYRGMISQICNQALVNVVSQKKKGTIDRLNNVPDELLMKAKKHMKENPIYYANMWSKIINKKCDTEVKPVDLLRRFYPSKVWKDNNIGSDEKNED
ncbi:hypothetical protein AYK24_08325 [Thermoplasmatales archaeon SG8-52-4]|nr:MAG: hypothetical protein AYK24_08325 [Thermoplasmatales archaeon SG8-52-4]